jgi:hypothetical protein
LDQLAEDKIDLLIISSDRELHPIPVPKIIP